MRAPLCACPFERAEIARAHEPSSCFLRRRLSDPIDRHEQVVESRVGPVDHRATVLLYRWRQMHREKRLHEAFLEQLMLLFNIEVRSRKIFERFANFYALEIGGHFFEEHMAGRFQRQEKRNSFLVGFRTIDF